MKELEGQVFQALHDHLASLEAPGTLRSLQRAVLLKAETSWREAGHWPLISLPIALHRQLGGGDQEAIALAGACALFYAFADITDDAQDHELTAEPWAAWGWEQAVNTGCSLLFACFGWLQAKLPGPVAGELTRIFARAGERMTWGQHRDLRGLAGEAPSLAGYLRTVTWKSGASFGAYCEAAARLRGLAAERVAAFHALGESLGHMFQMMNDTHELWGPGLSSDYLEGRASFPLVVAHELLGSEGLAERLAPPRDLARQQALVIWLETVGVRTYATVRIEVYRKQAEAAAIAAGVREEAYLARLLATPAFPVDRWAV